MDRQKISPGTQQPYDPGRTKNIEIYEYCLKATLFLDSRYIISRKEKDFQAAIRMIEIALEIDPNYDFAYTCLAYAYVFRQNITGSKEYLEKINQVVRELKLAKKNEANSPFWT